MKSHYLLFFLLACSFEVLGQYDTTVVKSRNERIPLQAVVSFEAYSHLYKGQEYEFTITASGNYDLKISVDNAAIKLAHRGDKFTGGMRYLITPKDVGTCRMSVGVVTDENRNVSLLGKTYAVIDYPMPPVHLNQFTSGEVITELKDSLELKCNYLPTTGVFDKYPILDWKVSIDGEDFTGKGDYLTQEVIRRIKRCKSKTTMRIELSLENNQTGYASSEGVFIIDLKQEKD